MTIQVLASSALAGAGVVAAGLAVAHERRMQRHRRPEVTYRDVTLRRDGGWQNARLFTAQGLHHQARASRWGVAAAALWVAALGAWVALA